MLFNSSLALCQDEITDQIAKIVYMDSIVVRASQHDFSVNDFIDLVRNDASFYLAFRNLRAAAYDFETEMTFLDRKDQQVAGYQSKHRQYFQDNCRYQKVLSEQITGDLFRKRRRQEKYYTFTLFDRLFLTHDTLCGIILVPQEISFDGKGVEGHVGELKKLIFAPGTRSDVPFIGNKTEIFSEKMINRYDFFIRSEVYGNTTEAYVFEARLKPDYQDIKDNKTVVKELITYFAKDNFQVLSRTYRLAHFKAFYSFDVEMNIILGKNLDRYFPTRIEYHGFWNVPTKKKETSSFTVSFDQFNAEVK
jgi:hypothetical protein